MEIRYLRHFLAVAGELHFGRAARRLNMEQAPLSQSIKRLETYLGVRLFERSARSGTRLTDAGRRLLPQAEAAVMQFDAVLQGARTEASSAPVPLRVGFVTLGLLAPLPRALRAMERQRPEVQVRLEEGSTMALLERVAEGRLDMALVHPVERCPAGVTLYPVRRDRIVVALAAVHPLAGRSRIALRDIAGEPLIFFPPSVAPDLHARLRDAFQRLDLEPRIEQEARSTPTILLMVAAGLGYGLVAESARLLPFSNVAFVSVSDLPEDLDWGIALAARTDLSGDAVRAFAGLILGSAGQI